ncbi:MAG: RagB/SusD family nutrient uptake outer membrane protein [Alistipes sp.]|nr:RagB/SusD family nutrient uptake outer membrane protein [Candidatus Alistipes equi]
MKNIFNYLIVACLAIVALSFAGCIKQPVPNDGVTSEQVGQDPNALKAIVGAIPVNMTYPYSALGSGNNYGWDFGYPGLMCVTDHATMDVVTCGGDDGDNYDWFSYWSEGWGIAHTSACAVYPWRCYYLFVKSCNDVIGVTSPESTGLAATYRAQALIIRALFYLDLARMYDPLEACAECNGKYVIPDAAKGLTIPWIGEDTDQDQARNNPRMTREEAFTHILGDLNEAVALYGDYTSSDRTVPSLAVAHGLLARAYLWLGGFNDKYEKVPTGNDAYKLAQKEAKTAKELFGAKPMSKAEWQSPTTGFNSPTSSWMWYIQQSTEGVTNLVNFIAWRSNESTWGYAKYVFQGVLSKFYDRISDTDWRKESFIGASPEEWYKAHSNLTNHKTLEAFLKYTAPYANMKFHPASGETQTWKTGNVTAVPLMRVEEMYLIEAEAAAQVGDASAAGLLNEFMSYRDPNYYFAGSTQILPEEIMFQKRVELWGEGVVFYDFKRLGYGVNTAYAGANVPGAARFYTTGRLPWWNFCIPQIETQQNLGIQDPNPNPTGILTPIAE